jgi:ring-1,2-phenylacetyl-CoA epoxidase subunit PaaC
MNAHIDYIIHLADSTLILSQRNSEWCGHGPILEQDIAITNISLDLLGQSRYFYQHAATLLNTKNKSENTTEDSLAYLRGEREFKNLLITELPNGDWGQTILRQFFVSVYHTLLYQQLLTSSDKQIAAIAEKSLKEVAYHVKWSSEWVTRLGNGTEESHRRMIDAINNLWAYTGEMFVSADYEIEVAKMGIGIDTASLKEEWINKIESVFSEATLPVPEKIFMQLGGKTGVHTEYLGYILTDLQYLQRVYPGAQW